MSTWIHLDGRIKGAVTPPDTTGPCGSEGCAKLAQLGDDSWYIANGDLRDRDVNDVPSILDWFARVCEAVAPDEASIEINVDTSWHISGSCYHYTWTGQRLELHVPQLHRAEIAEEIAQVLTRRSDEAEAAAENEIAYAFNEAADIAHRHATKESST